EDEQDPVGEHRLAGLGPVPVPRGQLIEPEPRDERRVARDQRQHARREEAQQSGGELYGEPECLCLHQPASPLSTVLPCRSVCRTTSSVSPARGSNRPIHRRTIRPSASIRYVSGTPASRNARVTRSSGSSRMVNVISWSSTNCSTAGRALARSMLTPTTRSPAAAN